MRSPRKRTWFCSTSIVAPSLDVRDAGLFELVAIGGQNQFGFMQSKMLETDKITERIEVLPLPEAPIRRTCEAL